MNSLCRITLTGILKRAFLPFGLRITLTPFRTSIPLATESAGLSEEN